MALSAVTNRKRTLRAGRKTGAFSRRRRSVAARTAPADARSTAKHVEGPAVFAERTVESPPRRQARTPATRSGPSQRSESTRAQVRTKDGLPSGAREPARAIPETARNTMPAAVTRRPGSDVKEGPAIQEAEALRRALGLGEVSAPQAKMYTPVSPRKLEVRNTVRMSHPVIRQMK